MNTPGTTTTSTTDTGATGAPGVQPPILHIIGVYFLFLLLPLIIGMGILLHTLDRFQERIDRRTQAEFEHTIDQIATTFDTGFPIAQRVRQLFMEIRNGWVTTNDFARFANNWKRDRKTGLHIVFMREGRIMFSSGEDTLDCLLQDILPHTFATGPELATQGRIWNEKIRQHLGQDLSLERLQASDGEFIEVIVNGRPGFLFCEIHPGLMAYVFLFEGITVEDRQRWRKRSTTFAAHRQTIGKAVPSIDVWTPPPGVARTSMQTAWELAQQHDGRHASFGGLNWFFRANRWGSLICLVVQADATGFPKFLEISAWVLFFLAAGWGAILLRRITLGSSGEFISIRHQLRFLFLYVTFLPLLATLLIGWFALQDQEERLRHEAFTTSLERLNTLELGFSEYLQHFGAICQALREQVKNSFSGQGNPGQFYQFASKCRHQGWFDQIHLLDFTGREIYSTFLPERQSVRQIFLMILNLARRNQLEHRQPVNERVKITSLDLVAEEAITSEELGWSRVIRQPGTLHDLTMGRISLLFFWDAFPDLATGPAILIAQQNRYRLSELYYRSRLYGQQGDLVLGAFNIFSQTFFSDPGVWNCQEIHDLLLLAESSGKSQQRELDLPSGRSWVVTTKDETGERISLLAAMNAEKTLASLAPWRWALAGVFFLSLLVAILAGRILTDLFLLPIHDLTMGIAAIRERRTDYPIPLRRNDELGRLAQAFNHMQGELKELELARIVQQDLLPRSLPDISGCSLAAINDTATDLGGDYYDVIAFSDGSVLLVIGDVTGHGPSAALAMAMAKACIAYSLDDFNMQNSDVPTCDLNELMTRINSVFYRELRGARKFMTLLLAHFVASRHQVSLCNAGHNFPFVFRLATRQCESIALPAIPIGFRAKPQPHRRTVSLAAGDVIILYTDGYTETLDLVGSGTESLGERLLQTFLTEHAQPTATAAQILHGLMADFATRRPPGPLPDDVTLVVLKRCC